MSPLEPTIHDAEEESPPHVAIVGMAGRFPGADSADALWRNLLAGREAIRRYGRDELLAAGLDAELVDDPSYVPAQAALDDARSFDAPFFDYSPLEAAVMDPQIRLFMTTCWEALEDGGLDPSRFSGAVGLFAGVSMTTYALQHVASHPDIVRAVGPLALRILNDKDFLATSVAHRFDLRGPAVTVQTACSTSLVATHLACRSLLDFECDAALAGGVTIALPEISGYVWEQGSIYSPDGRCRPFDAAAAGTVSGSGCGLVLLKRLEDAVADGDAIYAVIRGSAINNDGSAKVGYTAPSVDGQAEVIAAAQSIAEVEPDEIGYIEAHGTGTKLGDPIEVEALTHVFAERTERRGFCVLGSIKANVGHLDQAAGVAGLIKLAKVVETGQIPPIPNFETPNPEIDFAATPFVVAEGLDTFRVEGPRVGGVSSFGVGGTNAHVVVEEPPERAPSGPSRRHQLLTLSAATPTALAGAAERLADWLDAAAVADDDTTTRLADVAWTLQHHRKAHAERRVVVARDLADAARRLRSDDRSPRERARDGGVDVAFLFPGQGSQYPGMARGLYDAERVFRENIDHGADRLEDALGLDLRTLLLADPDDEEAVERLRQTAFTQPALFVVGLALARLFQSWGLEPRALLGHSVGELAAATVAGVFHPDDALELVAERGRLVQELPAGAMLSLPLPEDQVRPLIADFPALDLAVVNAADASVVAGPEEAIDELARRLAPRGLETRRLHTSHAFHSAMMEPALDALRRRVAGLALDAPSIPFVSNVTGTWITDAEATSADYWASQLRSTVRFADGVQTLAGAVAGPWLELGPGRTLSALARRHPALADRDDAAENDAAPIVPIPALPHARDAGDDVDAAVETAALAALGRAWAAGAEVDWDAFQGDEVRRKEHLPTYAFDRQPYWIEPRRPAEPAVSTPGEGFGDDVVLGGPDDVGDHDVDAPEGALETAVAGAVRELLGVRRVGRHDDFFELGGHSLLATQVVSRLRRGLGVDVKVEDLFAQPTPATLATVLAERGATVDAGATAEVETIPRVPRDGELPLSYGQQRLWFLHQLDPESPAYHMAFALRLDGALDIDALAGALDDLVERHESLRTAFPTTDDGRARQVVEPPAPGALALERVDLGSTSDVEGAVDEQIDVQTVDLVRRPFDLAVAPLARARLLRLADDAHALVLVLHHIVTDGWSMNVMVREIGALYAARVEGRDAELPALEIQYPDFAAWQRQWLDSADFEAQLGWWTERFAEPPPVLELPGDRPRGAVRSGEGARVERRLDPELTAKIERLGREHGATLFMVLLAALDALLHRLTGQTDVVVGTPVANRRRPELEELIGFFVNTLALRQRLEPAAPFSSLLDTVRADTLAAFDRQDVPFEQLVDALDLARDLDHTPLFQVMLALQNQQKASLEVPGLELTGLPAETGAAMFDWTLIAQPAPEGLLLVGEYATDRFDALTVEHWLERLETILRAVVARPETTLDELPTISEDEAERLADWSSNPRPLDDAHWVDWLPPVRVARHAAERPDAIAVVAPDGEATWRELLHRVEQIAATLVARGLRPEEPVAVCLDRRLDLPAAMLAAMRAGGAYLPLDPTYPEDRLRQMVDDARPRFLLTAGDDDSALPSVAADALERIDLATLDDNDGDDDDGGDRALPTLDTATLDRVAYVIFTSGSTGRPKGVLATHRGLANLVRAQAAAFGLEAGTRVLQAASLNFDASILEMAGALTAGGELHLATVADLAPGEPLARLLADRRIENVLLTPTVIGALGDARLPDLGCLVAGGEACSAELADRWAPGRRLINAYGPTETAICATFGEVEAGGGTPALGRPVENTRLEVLDARQRPVGIGVPGELCVASASLARGYLKLPARTAAAFLPDPAGDGGRLYRTGDLVCRRADGRLDFLGRIDHQVKVRGFRIELGEIDVALLAHPAVVEAITLARELPNSPGRRLIAWVRVEGEAPTPDALRAHLLDRLPEFMVPSAILVLDTFPLGPTGKIDREALPDPGAAASDSDHVEPRDDVERALVELWQEVLGLERVGVHDSFFTLGGDSILSIQMVARARQRGLGLTPQDLFRHQTVAELARAVEAVAEVDAEQGLVEGEVPWTPIQTWWLDELATAGDWNVGHWNQAVLLDAPAGLDSGRLDTVVRRLAAHHDALRLRFDLGAGGVAERPPWHENDLDAAVAGVVGTVDLSAVTTADLADAIVEAAETVQRSLDLAAGPIWRLVHLDAGDRPGRLLAVAHHLVIDAVSWRILLEDLGRLQADPETALPPKTTSWSSWARRLEALADSDELAAQVALWLDQSPQPTEAHASERETDVETLDVELDAALTDDLLRHAGDAYQTRIQELLLAALARAHRRTSGGPLLLDLEGHGRESERFEDVDLSRTVGWFTALYPVRLELDSDAPGEQIVAVKEQLRHLPDNGLGYGLLRHVRRADAPGLDTLRARPRPALSFNYLGRLDADGSDSSDSAASGFAAAEESVGALHDPAAPRAHELEIEARVAEGRFRATFAHATGDTDRRVARALADAFVAALRELVEHCLDDDAGAYTPSDFTDADLDDDDLESILGQLGDL